MELERLSGSVIDRDLAEIQHHRERMLIEAQQPELRSIGQASLERYSEEVLEPLMKFLELLDEGGEAPVASPTSLLEVITDQKNSAPTVVVVLQRGEVTKTWGTVDLVATITFDDAFTNLTMRQAVALPHAGGPRFLVDAYMVNKQGDVVGGLLSEAYPVNPEVTPEGRPSRVLLRSLGVVMPGRRDPNVVQAAEDYVDRQADQASKTLALLWACARDAELNPELAARLSS